MKFKVWAFFPAKRKKNICSEIEGSRNKESEFNKEFLFFLLCLIPVSVDSFGVVCLCVRPEEANLTCIVYEMLMRE